MTFRVEIHDLRSFSDKERIRCEEACSRLEIELNSPDFWLEVASKWDSWTHRWYMQLGIGKTPITFNQFKTMFLMGKDNFNRHSDNDLDLHLTMYYSWRNVVGYTYPSTWFTWINRKFFGRFDIGGISGNIAHEYLHNMGMDHPGTDKRSVVYQFGYLLRDRINKKRKVLQNIKRPIQKASKTETIKRFFIRIWNRIF
jgi:hypothetical protein